MCKNKELIKSCGHIFESLCIEIPPPNIPVICGYVMHALPCDFNPMLQSMAFKVLQSFIVSYIFIYFMIMTNIFSSEKVCSNILIIYQSLKRLKPSLSTKCIKPILDNLRTPDTDLLVSSTFIDLKHGH